MEQSYHPFFTQFSSFLNNLEKKSDESSNESVIPLLVVKHSDEPRVLFQQSVVDLSNQTKNLFEELKQIPSAVSFVDTTSNLLDYTLANIKQLSICLPEYVQCFSH